MDATSDPVHSNDPSTTAAATRQGSMALAIAHFAVGATLTTLLLWMAWPGMPYGRSAALFGGGWAMIPDAGKLDPFATQEVYAFHDSPAANVFWGHGYLDSGVADSLAFAAAAVAALLLASVLVDSHDGWRRWGVDAVSTAPTGHLVRSLARTVALLRRAVACAAIAAGAVLGVQSFLAGGPFAAVLVGAGAALGLFGLATLNDDRLLAALAARVVPLSVRVGTWVGISAAAGAVAVVLLSRVFPLTGVSVPYGALGLVVLFLLVRLWVPMRATDAASDAVTRDRTW
jgi:hypothetical protein